MISYIQTQNSYSDTNGVIYCEVVTIHIGTNFTFVFIRYIILMKIKVFDSNLIRDKLNKIN